MDGQREKGNAAALGLSVNPVRDSATEVQRAVSDDLVAAWEYAGADRKPIRNVEPLLYEEIKMSTRSYK